MDTLRHWNPKVATLAAQGGRGFSVERNRDRRPRGQAPGKRHGDSDRGVDLDVHLQSVSLEPQRGLRDRGSARVGVGFFREPRAQGVEKFFVRDLGVRCGKKNKNRGQRDQRGGNSSRRKRGMPSPQEDSREPENQRHAQDREQALRSDRHHHRTDLLRRRHRAVPPERHAPPRPVRNPGASLDAGLRVVFEVRGV